MVFASISKALNELSEHKTTGTKRLIILSDCWENTSLLSCYSPGMEKILKQNPDTIARLFAQQYPVERPLTGIVILIVNQPSLAGDETFYSLSNALTKYFTGLGATVTFESSLR
jgi:hypothetical protein